MSKRDDNTGASKPIVAGLEEIFPNPDVPNDAAEPKIGAFLPDPKDEPCPNILGFS